jgi:FkbM family methyltransferase
MKSLDTARFLMTHPLGRRAKVEVLRRFAQWQLASRLSPGPIAAPFVGEARLLVGRGMTGATGNIYVGLHEFADMTFVLHVLRAEDSFLDVGANIGAYTVLAGKVVGASCIAVEPIESTVAHLRDNVVLNAIESHVRVERCAVGEHSGVARMTSMGDTVNRIVLDAVHDQRVVEVPIRTLDELVADGPVPQVMKMDIEGYELPALRGATKLLSDRNLRACIIEVWSASGSVTQNGHEVLALMDRFGFEVVEYDAFTRALRSRADLSREGNTLFVRDRDWIASRVQAAPSVVVLNQRV